MKTRSMLFVAVAALAAFGLPASPAFAADAKAPEFKPFTLELPPGSSPAAARKILGAPHATLGADLWVYWNFGAPNPNHANPEFDTLVVAFARERVVAVKITDGRVVRQLLAQAAAQTKAAAMAANAPRR
ncbi:MAG: hypothetical protein HZA93_09800 [Verrucomicrobia bacterium]|nr:hypothetical protein [Verrucomicrobiota bacterium]